MRAGRSQEFVDSLSSLASFLPSLSGTFVDSCDFSWCLRAVMLFSEHHCSWSARCLHARPPVLCPAFMTQMETEMSVG